MARFTLTIELPDDYDTTVAEEAPDEVAQEILAGVFHDCELVDRTAVLLPRGHRIDATYQRDGDRQRFRLEEIEAPVVLVAVDCIDMSDHYPMPRKRAWLLELDGDGRPL